MLDTPGQNAIPSGVPGGGSVDDALIFVYPERGNEFYVDLARRLASACGSLFPRVSLVCSAALPDLSEAEVRTARIAAVNPNECLLTGPQVGRRLRAARRRIMVLAEAAGTEWYEKQFRLPIAFDALLDVGFVSQADRHAFRGVAYRFVWNAPTVAERDLLIQAPPPSPRAIPWAVVGHYTPERLALVDDLVRHVDPRGVAFLPRLRAVRRGSGLLGPHALHRMLGETRYYVWCTHHRFPYYESFRFRDALFAGCAPCKIDGSGALRASSIPGIYPSVDAFADAVRPPGDGLYRTARDFYLARGTLEDHLREALAGG